MLISVNSVVICIVMIYYVWLWHGFLGYVVMSSLVVALSLCVWFDLLAGGLAVFVGTVLGLVVCRLWVCIAGLFVGFVWLYCLLCVMIDCVVVGLVVWVVVLL